MRSGSRRSGCRSGSGGLGTRTQLPVVTMITGYPPMGLSADGAGEDLSADWWRLFEQLGAVPGARRGWRGRRRPLAGSAAGTDHRLGGFRAVLGTKVLVCKPADPEAKGDRAAARRRAGTVTGIMTAARDMTARLPI